MGRIIDFKSSPTLRAALLSSATVIIVQGPVESGKTYWLCMKMYLEMCLMPKCKDGIRRSRFLVTRTTEGELKRGVMRTWKNLFPEDIYGAPVGKMPAIHFLKFMDVECEVEFFAFDDDSDESLRKLRSTEYTSAFINEGQFSTLRFFKMVKQRTGRFPERDICPDYDRKKRVRMDMNAPWVDDHWVAYMRRDIDFPADMPDLERRKYNVPKSWEFFVQPGVVLPEYDIKGEISGFIPNPKAENLKHLNIDEIMEDCQTGDIDDVKRDYMNIIVKHQKGKPRYPNFKRSFHVSPSPIEPVEGAPVIIGYDPGLNGAVTFWQKVNNQWLGLGELICRDNPYLDSADKTGKEIKNMLSQRFPWYKEAGVVPWGDPFGTRGFTSREDTYYMIIAANHGIDFRLPAEKDNPTLRHQIGKKMIKGGQYGNPAMLLCPEKVPFLIDAFDGGCTMKQVKVAGTLITREEIDKNNKHADVIESAEYAFWGGGEDTTLIMNPEMQKQQAYEPAGRSGAYSRGRR